MKCHRHKKIMISLCTTLWAESPSIFLKKSGRGRRLCSWPALSLIRRSSKNMDESVQFQTSCTGLPLMRMLNWRNYWLFSPQRHNYCLQSIDKQVFDKAVKCATTKVKLDRFPGLFQASRNHNQGLCLIFFLATIRLSCLLLDMKNLWFIRSALQLQENLRQRKKSSHLNQWSLLSLH